MNRIARFLPLVALTLFLVPAANAQETVGFPLIERTFNGDTSTGVEVIANQSFTQVGTLTSWSFYNTGSPTTLNVTPFIAQLTGGSTSTDPIFTITGIGATRQNTGTGVQTFNFDLASGSSAVGSGYYFGFHSGTVATGQAGAVELTTGVGGTNPVFLYFNNSIAVGDGRSGNSGFRDRNYSFQGTANGTVTASAPEPCSIALLTSSLLPVVGLVARRRKS